MTDPTGPVLIVGFAVTGEAVARFVRSQGRRVLAFDDHTDTDMSDRTRRLEVELISGGSAALEVVLPTCSMAVVSPGIPPGHPIFGLCGQMAVPVTTEIELASREIRPPTRLVAVTGTNGKTTVVTLIDRMLTESGFRSVAAGNIGVPLLDALGPDVDVVVAETSSFQLALTDRFRPDVAVWLNVSPDHLDAHKNYEEYVQAKARIWVNQRPGDVAVVNADDPTIVDLSASAPSRVVTFGVERGDYSVMDGVLRAPDGATIAPVAKLPRHFPHDLVNGLAAAAAAMLCGAPPEACGRALTAFTGLPHRIEEVGEAEGVHYYDDSKATTPAAVVAAVEGFGSVVLIAGGRNKGLDMAPLASTIGRVRAVVAIGEAAEEVAAAFRGGCPVVTSRSMGQAVQRAHDLARPGDAVLLSPGCASFDWYRNYGERGDDFARNVRALVDGAGSEGNAPA